MQLVTAQTPVNGKQIECLATESDLIPPRATGYDVGISLKFLLVFSDFVYIAV